MFPVRCYTCNALLAHLHPTYRAHARDAPAGEALRAIGVERMCCRRMFLGHADLLEDQLRHPNVDAVLDDGGTVLQRKAVGTRVVACD